MMRLSDGLESDGYLTILDVYKGDKVWKIVLNRLKQTLLGEVVCANDLTLKDVVYVYLPIMQELGQRLPFYSPVDQLDNAHQCQETGKCQIYCTLSAEVEKAEE